MSRTVRKQIFKKLEELCSENQKIITDVIAEAQLQDTFARCQNMAVDIGTQIETVYGEGFDCVHGLEDYCELIYMTAVEQDMKKREDLGKRAEKILQNVIQYTQKEIPDKLEAVFLPYKASMWDSGWRQERTRRAMPMSYRFPTMTKKRMELLEKNIMREGNIPIIFR